MRRILVIMLGVAFLLPLISYAYLDCRENINGCTVAQLMEISNNTSLVTADRINALKQAVTMLNAQISAMGSNGTQTSSTSCVDLNNSLVIGSTDGSTSGEVSKLQNFLLTSGVYPEARITGYYGMLTAQAVVRWQKAHGMDFVTNSSGVGTMTRAKMACTKKAAVINSISPTSGPVGTMITLNGTGFLGFEGDKMLKITGPNGTTVALYGDRDSSDTQTHFKLPSQICTIDVTYSGKDCPSYLQILPGVYSIQASGWGGSNGDVTFTVTN